MSPRKAHRNAGIRPGRKMGSWIIDYYDHLSARHSKTFYGSEADAGKVRRAILAKVDRIKAGIEIAPEEKAKVLTLAQLWENFVADRESKIRAGAMDAKSLERAQYTYLALIDFDAGLKAKQLDRLRRSDFEGFMEYRIKQGFKPQGINTNLRGLRTLFNYAVDNDFLHKSPLKGVSPIRIQQQDARILNADELRTLDYHLFSINSSKQNFVDARDLILFYLYTGARLSEGLVPLFTWDNVGQGALHFPHTKMSKSRTIPMPEKVREILESRKHLPEGPFPFTKAVAYGRIKRLLRKAGINNASPHTLRKTAGSLFYLATRDIFAASRFLGHASVAVTERHYQGLIQSLQVENARKFEDVLSRNLLHICYDGTNQHQPVPIDLDAVGTDLPTGKVVLDGMN